ncbi:histone H4-like TAF Taf6, SAGA complex subunit [Entomophthora muscae]|uniref:Histone H4-like TAF Taf6, SAGA complex subunit n=1 Tax=Entomophthora muscae TaxID=34485 RepID=A0ACC2U7A7_9FUNG|nr:histone H4-like TAF Taf6, SAGA complex subunit [Entomophthora muscae]
MGISENSLVSTYPHEVIQDTSESLAISVSDEAVAALATDVEFRISEIVQEATKFMRHAKRNYLTTEDINHAIRVRSVEPVYGFNATGGINFEKVSYSNQDLYYLTDKEIDFDTLLASPLPPVPAEVTFTVHWLAIDGVQPAIPQNPTNLEPPEELPLKKLKIAEHSSTNNQKQAAVEVRPLVKQVLCRELRVYFERVASAVVANEPQLRDSVFESMRNVPGLHQLLPHFTQFITEKVKKNMRNLTLLSSMLSFVDAILVNPNFYVEPYLHQFLPALFSCLLGNPIGGSGPSTEELTPWKVRRRAGELIASICRKYSIMYPVLLPRVTKTLLRALFDPSKSLPTVYGAVLGIGLLGSTQVIKVLCPNLGHIGPRLQAAHQEGKAEEATKVVQIIVEVLSKAAQHEVLLENRDISEPAKKVTQAQLDEHLNCPALSGALRHSPQIDAILELFTLPIQENI